MIAHLLGDDTAWRLGRVSFNPVKHIDPFGTILLPGMLLLFHAPFLFGYARPVPVNFRALRSPRRKTPNAISAIRDRHSGRAVPWRDCRLRIVVDTR
jgi:Zn-dependent protease